MEKWWEDYAYLCTRTPHAPTLNMSGPSPFDRVWIEPGHQARNASLCTWMLGYYWLLCRKYVYCYHIHLYYYTIQLYYYTIHLYYLYSIIL